MAWEWCIWPRARPTVRVALKIIIPAVSGRNQQTKRFLREAAILGQLQHPHIVTFHEMGEINGQMYFSMDYVEGVDAGRLLKNNGPLPVAEAVLLICQMLAGLGYAHQKGFVHRDVKPANLLVTEERGEKKGKLADFGLARVIRNRG